MTILNLRKATFTMLMVAVLTCPSCEKFLDKTPNQQLAVIATLEDLQGLMDYHFKVNYTDASAGEASADNYFVTDAILNARPEEDKNMYIWAPSNVFIPQINSWNDTYSQVYVANAVLENAELLKDKITDKAGLEIVKATALFHRAKSYLNALSIWSVAYDPATASKDPGIPLVKTMDFNIKPTRASVKDGYDQVINDLLMTIQVLPNKTVHQIRPSKAAAYGLLSRAYLYMGDYENALRYANSALQIQQTLLDFNTLSTTANFPMGILNAEVVYEGRMFGFFLLSQARALINPELYQLYAANDLRKVLYYKSSGTDFIFKGYYATNSSLFAGIAVDELLLTRAECYARTGNTAKALEDVNLLLKNRIKNTSFVPVTAGTAAEALKLVKLERRKEFPFRNLRWMDIKRWNKEGDNIVLKRVFNGVTYTLQPNSPRYALAIPEDVITFSGMSQNP